MIPTPAAPALARTLMTRSPHADDYPHRSWSYPQGLLLWGMARLYARTGQAVYRDYIFDYVDHHVDAQGRVARFAGDSMDDVMTGSILVWAWRQTQDPRLSLIHIWSISLPVSPASCIIGVVVYVSALSFVAALFFASSRPISQSRDTPRAVSYTHLSAHG